MAIPVLPSTALLTVLLGIGLLFFIRASTKERIQQVQLLAEQPEPSLLEQLQQYFTQRAYRIAAVDAEQNLITFEGFVRPSAFLAIFLTLLAAIGILSLVLVASVAFPQQAALFPWLMLLSPLAGVFYWKKSGRPEQVLLRVETVTTDGDASQSLLTVTAHRDELAELQRAIALHPVE